MPCVQYYNPLHTKTFFQTFSKLKKSSKNSTCSDVEPLLRSYCRTPSPTRKLVSWVDTRVCCPCRPHSVPKHFEGFGHGTQGAKLCADFQKTWANFGDDRRKIVIWRQWGWRPNLCPRGQRRKNKVQCRGSRRRFDTCAHGSWRGPG